MASNNNTNTNAHVGNNPTKGYSGKWQQAPHQAFGASQQTSDLASASAPTSASATASAPAPAPGFGQPGYGFGQQNSGHGHSSYGFGKRNPAFGQPGFGQPGFGQPAFGYSGFGQSTPGFGQQAPGQPGFASQTPGVGQPGSGAVPASLQSGSGSGNPGFGQQRPGFDQPTPGSASVRQTDVQDSNAAQSSLTDMLRASGGFSGVQPNTLGSRDGMVANRVPGMFALPAGTAEQAHQFIDDVARAYAGAYTIAVQVERGSTSLIDHCMDGSQVERINACPKRVPVPDSSLPTGDKSKAKSGKGSGHDKAARHERASGNAPSGGIKKPQEAKRFRPAKQSSKLVENLEGRRGIRGNMVCGNCQKPGHDLAICAHPSEDGYVHGCPFCNTRDHENEGCPAERPTKLKAILMWAVRKRANRPPLAIYAEWVVMLRAAKQNADDQQLAPIKRFPWTPKMAKSFADTKCPPWLVFDYTQNNPTNLPHDYLTCNMTAVEENYDEIRHMPGPVPGSALLPHRDLPNHG